MPAVTRSESSRHPADELERPMDLSQSAANAKTQSDTTSMYVSQGCCPIGYSATGPANTCTASFVCSEKPVYTSAPSESSTSLTVCGSRAGEHVLLVNSLPHNSRRNVIAVPSSTLYQNSISPVIQHSAGLGLAHFSTALQSDTLSVAAASSSEKISSGDTGFKSERGVLHPKTKKQKAVDSQLLTLTNSLSAPTLDIKVSEHEALTFGEIQERLITKVVESGSLSRVLCGEQRRAVSSSKHHVTGKLPSGWFSHCLTSQNRFCLAPETTSSELSGLQKAGTLSDTVFYTKQQSVASTTQGLCFQLSVLV